MAFRQKGTKSNIFFFTYWKSILWIIFVSYLLFLPGNKLPKEKIFEIPHFDKIVHTVLFLVLEIVLLADIRPKSLIGNRAILFRINPVVILYAIVTELVQKEFIPDRTGSFYDLLADTAGIITGMLLYGLFLRIKD